MVETLFKLLNRCTVRIVVPTTQIPGTGFFVTPGHIITCAHVVEGVAVNTRVQLFWRAQLDQPFQELWAQVRASSETQDLALLTLEDPPEHPCAWLGGSAAPFQSLYSFGYPTRLAGRGTSTTVECEGWLEGSAEHLLSLKAGQVSSGMSGSPLLNVQTGQVCGVLAWTKDEWSALGGRAILTQTIWQVFPELKEAQAQWKRQDQRWRTCLEAHQYALAPSSTKGDRTIGQASLLRDRLPLLNPLFQERPKEFANLEHLLFGQDRPVRLGLVGIGGIGKTQLALQLTMRYRQRFPDGIFWMPATGQTLYDWQPRLADLAERTGHLPLDDAPGQPDTEQRRAKYFAAYLAKHIGALLVLDNVEQPELVASALAALSENPQPACTVLYTSRKQISPPGVWTYPLGALDEPGALNLLLAETRPAVLAAAQRTGEQNTEIEAARSLCQTVGFLPLGLIHLYRLLKHTPTLTLARLAEGVRERGTLAIAKYEFTDTPSLFATFLYSWEQVQDVFAKQVFYLASFFPEAIPIPLWLLGLAAGLGKRSEPWEPLGEACQELYELSLLEMLAEGQARLHPLVREFAQRLVAELPDQGQQLIAEAGERLIADFWHLKHLEQRARREGYWVCLEQVRAAASYAGQLGTDREGRLTRLVRWLDRENNVLAPFGFWPEHLPGLFFQQLHNRAVEAEHLMPSETIDAPWLRQLAPIRAEDPALLRIFVGHQNYVTSVAFSPDGKQALTGSWDQTARLWEIASGKLLRIFAGHQDIITSVAFSPDGQRVLTGSWDQTAVLWETGSGKPLWTLEKQQGWVESVAFSPNGRQILTCSSEEQTARLWEIASGKLLLTLEGHVEAVKSVAFSPDGQQILTGSADQTARLWETASGKPLRALVLQSHLRRLSRSEASRILEQQGLHDPGPQPLFTPALIAAGHGRPRTKPLRQFPPG